MTLPLFPDLLESRDQFGRNKDFKHVGSGVWPISRIHVPRRDTGFESIHLVVTYEDRRWSLPLFAQTPPQYVVWKCWTVEIRHYRSFPKTVTTGWGSSKKTQNVIGQMFRVVEKSFMTREQAIQLAEKLDAILQRLATKHDGGDA